jgi:hypothetical protein
MLSKLIKFILMFSLYVFLYIFTCCFVNTIFTLNLNVHSCLLYTLTGYQIYFLSSFAEKYYHRASLVGA